VTGLTPFQNHWKKAKKRTLSKHSDYAKELFKKGYNCSQSLFAAFCDESNLDFEDALKISSSFGGGMGRLREVCGAVSGMFMVVGVKYGYTDPTDKIKKSEHYKLIQSLAKRFEEKNSSLICRELLGLTVKQGSPIPEDRTEAYYKKRPCAELVEYAAQILDEYIKIKNMEEKEMMRIAVAGEGKNVTEHFGHCVNFLIYNVENGKITNEESIPNPGHKPGFLPNFLADRGVNVIISGGMGGGAVDIFNERNIEVVVGASGDAKTRQQVPSATSISITMNAANKYHILFSRLMITYIHKAFNKYAL